MCWAHLEYFLDGVNINAHPVSVLKKKMIQFSVPTYQVCEPWKQFLFLNSCFRERPNAEENLICSSSLVFSTSCFQQLPHVLCYKPKGCDSPHFLWKQIKDLKRLLNSIPASDFAAWKHWMSQLTSPCMWVYLLNTNGSWLETESWREVGNPLNWHQNCLHLPLRF